MTPKSEAGAKSAASTLQVPAPDGAYWLSLAERECVANFRYRVTVSTHASMNTGIARVDTPGNKPFSMTYSPDKGLRLDSATGAASFAVDVASMLRKMDAKLPWMIDHEEVLDGQAAVCLSSATERSFVRLWIAQDNGAVLQFEQEIDGRRVATCRLDYATFNGTLLPVRATTAFAPTGRTIVQDYEGYTITN